eukprot:GHVS01017114.1.p1 GENE.GHVS01017114.1~~GHVS01017114.1.p1  ORF type:complete len:706 (+),score=73.71 GHVS01017114.1:77-2194(+)
MSLGSGNHRMNGTSLSFSVVASPLESNSEKQFSDYPPPHRTTSVPPTTASSCASSLRPSLRSQDTAVAAKRQSAVPEIVRTTPFNLNRYVLLACYSLVALLSGNVYWGWSLGLREMMFRASAYEWVCTDGEETPCTYQQELVGNLLIYSFTAHFVCSIFAGIILDSLGPKIAACVGQIVKAIGWLLLGFSTESLPAYIPAFVLIGASCDIANFPIFIICNIFLEQQVLSISIVGAAAVTSTAIPLVMNAVWVYLDKGPSFLSNICGAYVGLCLGLCMLNSVFLVPWKPLVTTYEVLEEIAKDGTTASDGEVEKLHSARAISCEEMPSQVDTQPGTTKESHNGGDDDAGDPSTLSFVMSAVDDATFVRQHSSCSTELSARLMDSRALVNRVSEATQPTPAQTGQDTLQRYPDLPILLVKSVDVIQKRELPYRERKRRTIAKESHKLSTGGSFWSCLTDFSYLLILPYMCIALIRTLFLILSGKEQLGEAYNVWAIICTARAVPLIILGCIARKLGVVWLLGILNAMGIVGFITLLIGGVFCQYVSMLCGFVFTASNLTALYSYIAETQPKAHFGKLCGIASLVAGVVQLISIPLFHWCKQADEESFMYANIVILVLGVINIPLVVWAYFLIRKRKTSARLQAEMTGIERMTYVGVGAQDMQFDEGNKKADYLATQPPVDIEVEQQRIRRRSSAVAATQSLSNGLSE